MPVNADVGRAAEAPAGLRGLPRLRRVGPILGMAPYVSAGRLSLLVPTVRWGLYLMASLVLAVILAALVAVVGSRLLGYSPFIVYGSSMQPAVPVGSVAIMEAVPPESLKVGDVIVFRPPSPSLPAGQDPGQERPPLIHRIVSIEEVDGQRLIGTKGDANSTADPVEVQLEEKGGRVVYVVPYLGYLLGFARTPVGWVALVILPAICLAFSALRRIWAPTLMGGRASPEASA